MKNLVRSTVLMGLVALGASCTSTPVDGQFIVHWNVTLNGVSSTCSAAGATTVTVYLTPVFSGGTSGVFSAPCSTFGMTTGLMPADDYWVDVDLVDASGNVIDTISPSASFSLFGGDILDIGTVVFNETTFVGQGYFSVSWTLTDHTGRPIACATAGATKFQLTATNLANSAVDIFLYNCTMGTAVTDPLPPGNYRVQVDLLDASNRMLNSFTPTAHYAIIDGRITRLGTFEFNFTNI